jgi:hypothetical protein
MYIFLTLLNINSLCVLLIRGIHRKLYKGGIRKLKDLKFKVWDTVRQSIFKPQAITFDIGSLAPFAVKVPGRSWEPVGKFELLQWIGLSDGEGADVYEGDLIKISSRLYEIAWNEELASFELTDCESSLKRSISDVTLGYVVGSRFQKDSLKRKAF